MSNLERAGHRLGTGLHAAVKPLLAWPAGGVDGTAVFFRWIGVAGTGGIVYMIASSGPGEFLLTLLVLGGMAWAKGTKQPAPEVKPDATEPQPEPVPSPEAAEAAMELFVEQALAAAKQEGHHGTHLSTLLAALHRQGRLTHWTVTDLGSYLRGIGIPLRDSVRVGDKTRVGVHHDDLRNHLGRSPNLPPHMVPDLTPDDGAHQEPSSSLEEAL